MQACGAPPKGVRLELCWGETDYGEYPYIGVVWEEPLLPYGDPPDEYIEACIEAYERFDTPEEVYDEWRTHFKMLEEIENLWQSITKLRSARAESEEE